MRFALISVWLRGCRGDDGDSGDQEGRGDDEDGEYDGLGFLTV